MSVTPTFNMKTRGADNNVLDALAIVAREARFRDETLLRGAADSVLKAVLPSTESDGSAFANSKTRVDKNHLRTILFEFRVTPDRQVFEAVEVLLATLDPERDIQQEIRAANQPLDVLQARREIERTLFPGERGPRY